MKKYYIQYLPHWVLTDLQPAFYDSESGTVLQQMSRLYPKIQELIKTYNDFVTDVNRYIQEFEEGIIKDFDCFQNCIIKTMNDYIQTIDMKINLQDTKIANKIDEIDNKINEQDNQIANKFDEQDEVIQNAVDYMKTNLVQTVNDLFSQALQNGDIVASLHIDYTPSTESLVLSIVAESEGE